MRQKDHEKVFVVSRARRDLPDVTMTMSDMPQRSDAGDQGANQSAASPRSPRAETPKRRTFTAAYKRRIIQQYDALTDPTERGALLRREGLYHSHLEYWRAARDKDAPNVTKDKPAGRPPRSAAEVENERLRAENEKLVAELTRTKAALDVAGKVYALLETLSESADSDPRPSA